MQTRFTLFKRGLVFYSEDRETGQQRSLKTRDETEAQRILQAKNDAVRLPQMNLVMAKTYLSAQDPKMIIRTWADVFGRSLNRNHPKTRLRHERVVRSQPMQFLKDKRLIETTADDLFVRKLPHPNGRWSKPGREDTNTRIQIHRQQRRVSACLKRQAKTAPKTYE